MSYDEIVEFWKNKKIKTSADLEPALKDRAMPRCISMVSVNVEEYAAQHFSRAVKKTLTIPQWLNERALVKKINFSKVPQTALIHELKLSNT